MTASSPDLNLNKELTAPLLGLGTWKLTGKDGQAAVETALELGYRHIDTAEHYHNQPEIGAAIQASGLQRSQLFITSKIWRTNLAPDQVKADCHQTLSELKTEYLDLYLIHWPNRQIPVNQTLTTMQRLKDQGLVKAIGVSNFTISHLQEALITEVTISNNQVELHPSLQQAKLRRFCQQHNITITAYSPLAQGKDFSLAVIKKLADKYDRSEAQVILAWLRQKEIIAIPRSSRPQHLVDNWNSLSLELTNKEIDQIDHLDQGNRIIVPTYHEFD